MEKTAIEQIQQEPVQPAHPSAKLPWENPTAQVEGIEITRNGYNFNYNIADHYLCGS